MIAASVAADQRSRRKVSILVVPDTGRDPLPSGRRQNRSSNGPENRGQEAALMPWALDVGGLLRVVDHEAAVVGLDGTAAEKARGVDRDRSLPGLGADP